MYIPFGLKKKEIHKKMYKIKIAPKEGWLDMPKNITYVPFFGTLETNISDKTYKLFSFYYSIDKDTLRIDNIKFITQSPLFSLSKYKDIYYDYLFDALILHMKNCPYTKTLIKKLYISSQDAFSIEKMIDRKFSIKINPIADNRNLYIGFFSNDTEIPAEKTSNTAI